jgi:outer membrane immunogenic protein
MRAVSLCLAIAIGLTVPAGASDLYSPHSYTGYKDEPSMVGSWTWAGLYVGGSGGYGWGNAGKFTVYSGGGTTLSNDFVPQGAMSGGQFGYNWQEGRIVLGIEADFQGSDIGGHVTVGGIPARTAFEWFITARARAGFTPASDTLIYITGGIANGMDPSSHDHDVKGGYVLGGGVEYALSPKLSAKVEYQFVNFGKEIIFAGTSPYTAVLDAAHSYNTARAGINYHLTSSYEPLK